MTHIQNPDTSSKLRSEFRTREPLGPFELGRVIHPVALVSDLAGSSPLDESYPRSCMGLTSIGAGGAGTNVQCILVAPAGVRKVYEVHRCYVTKVTSAAQVQIRGGSAITGAPTAVGSTKSFQDFRIGAAPDADVVSTTPLTAALDGVRLGLLEVPTDSIEIILGVVLGPSDFVIISNDTANEGLACMWFWTEYILGE